MSRTTSSGPVKSDNGFEGSFVGTLNSTSTGNTITTTNTATSGTFQPLVVSTTMSGAGADGGRANFNMNTNVALGSFSNALKADVTYGASGRTTGLGSSFVAEMTLSAGLHLLRLDDLISGQLGLWFQDLVGHCLLQPDSADSL